MNLISKPIALVGAIAASIIVSDRALAQGPFTNPFNPSPVTVDGTFTSLPEWSAITPSSFITSPSTSPVPTTTSNPAANMHQFAALGNSPFPGDPVLFLMHDFLFQRGTQSSTVGNLLATVSFEFAVAPNQPTQPINVMLLSAPGPSFFDVFVDLDIDGIGDVTAVSLGISSAASFAPSPALNDPHLQLELLVPIRIAPGFATPTSPLPGGGIDPATGAYDPDPIF
jgi:hypothetical protein